MSSCFSWLLIVGITYSVNYSFGRDQWNNYSGDFCYAEADNPYLYFSSKTSYNAVYYRNNIDVIPRECKPKQLWMLIRHGARYPLKKKVEMFKQLSELRNHIVHNHEKHHRGELCDEDIQNLKEWRSGNIPLTESDHLTKQGYDDLRAIGDRTWNKFKDLFNSTYSQQKYKVQFTNFEKTRLSAEAFTTGLFGRKVELPETTKDDLLNRIFPSCKVLPMPGANDPPDGGKNERSLFKTGPIVAEMLKNISVRLGFTHTLTMDEVDNIYDMCRYKKSWIFEELSPWCACFLPRDLQILEYIGDLSYYYNSGHGYSTHLRTGCPLVQDLIHRFRDIVTNRYNNQPNAVFYFGHSTTMYNLVARLGIAKDPVRITHDNYYSMSARMWRTSLIAPFSANFAAVLLSCDSGVKSRVVFYHNETPFRFNECHGYVCSWDILENMYGNITDPSTCNFNFCEDEQNNKVSEVSNDKNNITTDVNFVLPTNNGTLKAKPRINVTLTTSQFTTEKSNVIHREIMNNHELRWNKVLHRKVTQIKSDQEIVRVPAEKDTDYVAKEIHEARNSEMKRLGSSGTYKPKTKWEDQPH